MLLTAELAAALMKPVIEGEVANLLYNAHRKAVEETVAKKHSDVDEATRNAIAETACERFVTHII